jgi:hypothetical protein
LGSFATIRNLTKRVRVSLPAGSKGDCIDRLEVYVVKRGGKQPPMMEAKLKQRQAEIDDLARSAPPPPPVGGTKRTQNENENDPVLAICFEPVLANHRPFFSERNDRDEHKKKVHKTFSNRDGVFVCVSHRRGGGEGGRARMETLRQSNACGWRSRRRRTA